MRITITVNDPYEIVPITGARWQFALSACLAQRSLRQLWGWIRCFFDADIIMSVGGGYLNSMSWRRMSLYNTLSLALAVGAKRNVLCLPQSIGPFKHAIQSRFVATLLRRAAVVMAREAYSMNQLQQMGLAAKSHLVPDTAFLLKPLQGDVLLSAASELVSTGQPLIGMSVLDWSRHDPDFSYATQASYEKTLAQFIQFAAATYNAKTILFVQSRGGRKTHENDLYASLRVKQMVDEMQNSTAAVEIHSSSVSVNDYRRAYRQTDFFVSTRLHAALMAMSVGVPVLGIAYLPKTAGVMKMMGLAENALDIHDLTLDQLIAAFDRLWVNRQSTAMYITTRFAELGRECEQSIAEWLIRLSP